MRFGLEALQEICGQPDRRVEDCPTCRAIPERSRWYEEGDEVKEDTIPPEARKLATFMLLDGTNLAWIARCPECRRIYWMTDEYEYNVFSPSTTDKTITRIDGAQQLLDWITSERDYEDIVRDGDVWRVHKAGLWQADRRETPSDAPDDPPGPTTVALGNTAIPAVVFTRADVLPTFEGEDLESQLQTYDSFLEILSPVVRPDFVALFRKAAAATTNSATRARLEAAADSVARGERAAALYDHAAAMRKYTEEHRRAYGLDRADSEIAHLAKSLSTLTAHGGAVRSVAVSADGTTLASASLDKTIKLWDVATHKEINSLMGHTDWINAVSFSGDGKLLASGSDDKMVRLWDVAAGKELATLSGHHDEVMAVSFSPRGGLIASAGDDNKVRLWDTATREEIRVLAGHGGRVNSVSFSPDGNVVASGSDDATVKLWDVESGREIRTFVGHAKRVNCVSFAHDGSRLASGSDDGTARLWDIATGTSETLSGHESDVVSVAFAPDGKTLATGSSDHTIRLWDATERKAFAKLSEHGSAVRSICFSPGRQLLASGSDDRTIKLWDVPTPPTPIPSGP